MKRLEQVWLPGRLRCRAGHEHHERQKHHDMKRTNCGAALLTILFCALDTVVRAQNAAPAAAQTAANPLYSAWKGQEGKTVTFSRTESISGGAPARGGGARAASTNSVQFALSEITAEQATIKVTPGSGQPAETLVIPAKLGAGDPAFPKSAGSEEVKIGDKTYACTKYTYATSSKAELGRDPQGLRGRVTVWVADGVPGGIVQRKISLTIRASYEITDRLLAK